MREIIYIFIGTFVWLLFIPILFFPFGFLILWKCVSLFVALTIRRREMPGEMGIVDTSFTLKDNYHMIGWAIRLDNRIGLEEFRDHFRNTFLANDKFRIFLNKPTTILGFSYMTKLPTTALNLENQIYEKELTPQETEEEEALKVIQDNSRILGENVPKWEVVLLQLKRSSRTTLIFKMNHGLGDAISARYLIDMLFGNEDQYRHPPSPTLLQKAIVTIKFFHLALFLRIPTTMWNASKAFGSGLQSSQHPFPSREKGLDSPRNTKYAWGTLDFQKIRQTAKTADAKVLSVLMALQLSSLNQLFAEDDERRNEIEGAKETENKDETAVVVGDPKASVTQTLIMVPMPAPDHPILRNEKCCNHASLTMYISPLPGKEGDCTNSNRKEYLAKVDTAVRASDSLRIAETASLLYSFLDPILPRCLVLKLIRPQPSTFLLFLNPSIFSGNECKLLGAKAEGIFFLTHLDEEVFKSRGLLMTPITVGGRIDVAVHGSDDIFKDVGRAKRFIEILKEEADKLSADVSQ